MNLSDLFIVCSHGRRSAHQLFIEQDDEQYKVREGWCPGGRPVTLEDLKGFGLYQQWTDRHSRWRWVSDWIEVEKTK